MAEIEFTFKGTPEDLQKIFGTEYRVKAMLFDQVLSQHQSRVSGFPAGTDPLDVLFPVSSSQPLLPPTRPSQPLPEPALPVSQPPTSNPQPPSPAEEPQFVAPVNPSAPSTLPEPNVYQEGAWLGSLLDSLESLLKNPWMFVLLLAIATGIYSAMLLKPNPFAQKLFRIDATPVEVPTPPSPAEPASTTATPEPSPTPNDGLIERLDRVIGEPSATP